MGTEPPENAKRVRASNGSSAVRIAQKIKKHALKLNACLLLVIVWRPNGPGTGLFSRGLVTPVSWALERFTTVFGMGTGGTTPLSPPGPIGRHASTT